MTETDVQHQIQKLLDGEISADELAALETELMDNPEAMETYRDFLELHCALEDEIDGARMVRSQSVVPIDRILALQRKFIIKASLMGAAAIVLLTMVTMWYFQTPDHQPTMAKFQTAPGSDFTLTHSGEGKAPAGKNMVEGSRLVLRHGVAELKLPHDVRAVVEAPAEMVLRDDRTLELAHGRALFQVTTAEGQGFTVTTPHQRIVDLGTAFGIDFQKGRKEIELHVLEGQVRVDGIDGKQGEIIKANRSVMLAGTRVKREIDNAPFGFLRHLPPKIDTLIKENFATGLLAGQNYIIRMDPYVIRDLKGNDFGGIDDDTTWNFTTRTTAPLAVVSYSSDIAPNETSPWNDTGGELTDGNSDTNDSLVGWNGEPRDKSSFPTITFNLGKVHDVQTIGLSARNTNGTIHSVDISVSHDGIHYSKPVNVVPTWSGINPAKTQLDVSTLVDARYYRLRLVGNDWVMLSEVDFNGSAIRPVDPSNPFGENDLLKQIKNHPNPSPQLHERDQSTPVAIAVYPDDSATLSPVGQLKMLFNEPIKFGSGRVFVQNVTNWDENIIVVGDHRLSIDDRVLMINPPIKLKDGIESLGWLAGWESRAPVIFLNPRGDGTWYNNDDLQDDNSSHGMVESMRNPGMTSINKPIRREIGTITAESRYTVSAAIGVRADDAEIKSTFPGYTIRLSSGDTVLTQLTSDTPPGPANSVNTVGFSWDATTLPKGVNPGDPLSIEIIPNRVNGPGYLDLNALRITVLGKTGK